MKRQFLTAATAAILSMSSLCSCSQEVEVYPIQDNLNPRIMARSLFAEAPDSIIERLGLQEGIPSSVCAFLVKTEGQEILFDAANGAPDSQLMSSLESLSVKPADIDIVFITHLHGDHFGGLLKDGEAAFPNATIYLNELEYDAWMNMPAEQTGKLRNTLDKYQGKVVCFNTEDKLPCGIEAIEAYGHTPGHTVYRIGDVLIAGDIMHGVALQMEYPEFCARFDMDKANAVESRKATLGMAAEDELTVYGMHFPAPYFIKF